MSYDRDLRFARWLLLLLGAGDLILCVGACWFGEPFLAMVSGVGGITLLAVRITTKGMQRTRDDARCVHREVERLKLRYYR